MEARISLKLAAPLGIGAILTEGGATYKARHRAHVRDLAFNARRVAAEVNAVEGTRISVQARAPAVVITVPIAGPEPETIAAACELAARIWRETIDISARAQIESSRVTTH